MIDKNLIWKVKLNLEKLHSELKERHNELLYVLEDSDCIPDNEEDFNKFYSSLKEYESDIEKIESMLIVLKSHNTKIESLYNQVKILKKRRVTKLKSNLELVDDDDCGDDNMPF